jgi:hypothetical protein
MKVGDLVKMRPAVAPPKLYGIGIIVKTERHSAGQRCYIRWSKLPHRSLAHCASYALELVSESR